MPFTVGFMQKLTGTGEHHARAMRNDLIERGVLVDTGRTYKSKRHGYRVKLYRVYLAAQGSCSVRRKRSVKAREPWWRHPMFGFPGKSYRETGCRVE